MSRVWMNDGGFMLFDFETLAAQDRYKLLTATVVPRPIAWVVTEDLNGVRNAAPYSFFNVFANDPPVMVIGIGGRKPGDSKDTGANISATGQFVVNLVGEANAGAMNVTAIDFPPEVDEIAEAGLTTVASVKVRPPRAESPVARMMMSLELNVDRVLVIGRVLAACADCVLDPVRCHVDTRWS